MSRLNGFDNSRPIEHGTQKETGNGVLQTKYRKIKSVDDLKRRIANTLESTVSRPSRHHIADKIDFETPVECVLLKNKSEQTVRTDRSVTGLEWSRAAWWNS